MSMISEQVKQIRAVADSYREMKCDICTQKVLYEAADTIEALSAKVREQNLPVHGEWVGFNECSVCGKQAFDFIEGCVEGVEYLPNFCPNCGAKME